MKNKLGLDELTTTGVSLVPDFCSGKSQKICVCLYHIHMHPYLFPYLFIYVDNHEYRLLLPIPLQNYI